MIIYVDADACPVRDEVIKVASRYAIEVFMVADGGLRPSRDPLIKHHIVPQGADAADDWIAGQVGARDIVVTADIPLAKRCLDKQAIVIRPNGKLLDEAGIGMALAMRDLKQHIREAEQTQTYNAGFTKADRSYFLQNLDRVIQQNR